MPPRFAYWTILAGGLPTAFRAASRDELMPTFQRLRDKHPDAIMKWFARGKLWDSPEDARAAYEKRRQLPERRRERGGTGDSGAGSRDVRGRDWRPGGDHRDPRQKYADAKKARNAARRKQRFERKQSAGARRDDTRPFQKSQSQHRNQQRPGEVRDRERPRGPDSKWEKRPRAVSTERPNVEGERRPFEKPAFTRSGHGAKPSRPGRSFHEPRQGSGNAPGGQRPGEPKHAPSRPRRSHGDRRFRRR